MSSSASSSSSSAGGAGGKADADANARYVVLGATGHVGSATVRALLGAGAHVTAVTRDANGAKAVVLRNRGAQLAVADMCQPEQLCDVLRSLRGHRVRLFVLNPPAAPSSDTDAVEHESIRAILSALSSAVADGLLERIVALSTYGARPGKLIGDMGTLHTLEEGLRALHASTKAKGGKAPPSIVVIRGAYYYSNLDEYVKPARDNGEIVSLFPRDTPLPMVDPEDLGRMAASLLRGDTEPAEVEVHFGEGPAHCSFADVAATLSELLASSTAVRVVEVPADRLEQTFRQQFGFSYAATSSYAGMMRLFAKEGQGAVPGDTPAERVHKGQITLKEYLAHQVDLVKHKSA